MDYRECLAADPGVRSGQMTVRGTRVTVSDVLDGMALGLGVPEILEEFPRLSEESVFVCLVYAAERCRGSIAAEPGF